MPEDPLKRIEEHYNSREAAQSASLIALPSSGLVAAGVSAFVLVVVVVEFSLRRITS